MPETDSPEELEDYHEILNKAGDKLPKPTGWKVLVAVPKVDRVTDGGIYKPDEAINVEEVGTIIGLVLQMGDLAFKDPKKFPTGPWCHRGDYIMMRSYSGTRFKVGGQEFRLINDDTIEAVVDDPRGVAKVL
jgi:co-chaperonin GroES (HSP10)